MSLVSTASDSSARSCLHSAATSAVLPDPTGPPTPMRSGSPGSLWRLGRSVCTWGSPAESAERKCGGMACLSGDEQGALALAVPLGQHVEQRIGQVGQLLAGLGCGRLAQRRQLEG